MLVIGSRRIAIPFSERTLERGFKALKDARLVDIRRAGRDPFNSKRFERPRNICTNRFHELEQGAELISGAQLATALADT